MAFYLFHKTNVQRIDRERKEMYNKVIHQHMMEQ